MHYIIVNVENICAAEYFCGNWDFFFQHYLMNKKFKIALLI